jgi:hypothetical protein
MIYGHKLSYRIRVALFFALIGVLMIILPLLTNSLDPDPAYAVDIVILLIFGFLGGVV